MTAIATSVTDDLIQRCRVCLRGTAYPFTQVQERQYWRCPECRAIFLDGGQLPDRQTEYEEYLLHNNDPSDPRYRGFLGKLAEPLRAKLTPGMKGLDFGCGAGPALGFMLAEMGYGMSYYDPFFYQSDPSVLNQTYDFILCSEVAEHFHQPAREFSRLDGLLNPHGWLGIMTCFPPADPEFANWHYRRELSHVVFYGKETLEYLAWQYGWHCDSPARDIVLMQKSKTSAPFTRRLAVQERT